MVKFPLQWNINSPFTETNSCCLTDWFIKIFLHDTGCCLCLEKVVFLTPPKLASIHHPSPLVYPCMGWGHRGANTGRGAGVQFSSHPSPNHYGPLMGWSGGEGGAYCHMQARATALHPQLDTVPPLLLHSSWIYTGSVREKGDGLDSHWRRWRGRRSYISAAEAFLHQQQQQNLAPQPLVGGAGNAHPTRGEGRRRGGDASSRLKDGEKEQRLEMQHLEQPNSQQPHLQQPYQWQLHWQQLNLQLPLLQQPWMQQFLWWQLPM